MPFNKLAIKKAVKGIRRRATGFVLLAILFLVIGILQDFFASYQIHKTTTLELNGWANEIQPAFLKEDKDNKSHFYKREDGRTKELDSKETFMILQSKRQSG